MASNEVLKVCSIHGELRGKAIKTQRTKKADGTFGLYHRCRECFRQKDLASWYKHKEAKLPFARVYKEKNKQELAVKAKAYEREQRELLGDRYIRQLIIDKTKLKANTLKQFPELIDLKRISVLIKREAKIQQEQIKKQQIEEVIDNENR